MNDRSEGFFVSNFCQKYKHIQFWTDSLHEQTSDDGYFILQKSKVSWSIAVWPEKNRQMSIKVA